MRKIIFILAVVITPFFIGSCEKDSGGGPDLTKDIAGSYTGTLMIENNNGTNVLSNITIKVTKVDNSTVTVEPNGQTASQTFDAKLSEATDGIAMKINEQDILGGTLIGYTQDSNNPDVHGGLTSESTDDEPFFYSIKLDLSGYTEYRIFLGSPAK
jgi:hypothetical protein